MNLRVAPTAKQQEMQQAAQDEQLSFWSQGQDRVPVSWSVEWYWERKLEKNALILCMNQRQVSHSPLSYIHTGIQPEEHGKGFQKWTDIRTTYYTRQDRTYELNLIWVTKLSLTKKYS